MALSLLLLGIFLINLPCGCWREGVRKFSPAWFVAVHAPVPLVFVMRRVADVEWSLTLLPLLVAAYFLGQWVGAWWRRSRMAG